MLLPLSMLQSMLTVQTVKVARVMNLPETSRLAMQPVGQAGAAGLRGDYRRFSISYLFGVYYGKIQQPAQFLPRSIPAPAGYQRTDHDSEIYGQSD